MRQSERRKRLEEIGKGISRGNGFLLGNILSDKNRLIIVIGAYIYLVESMIIS